MTRRRFSERQVLAVLLLQGVVIPCFRCGEPITDAKDSQREHLHEIALGGPDVPANCRFSHTDCHAVVTDGPKATKANSSKGRIAKAKRIVREGKMLPAGESRAAGRIEQTRMALAGNAIAAVPTRPPQDTEPRLFQIPRQGARPP